MRVPQRPAGYLTSVQNLELLLEDGGLIVSREYELLLLLSDEDDDALGRGGAGAGEGSGGAA